MDEAGRGLSAAAKRALIGGGVVVLLVLGGLVALLVLRVRDNAGGLRPDDLSNHLLPITTADGVSVDIPASEYDIETLLPEGRPEDDAPRLAILGGSVLPTMAGELENELNARGVGIHMHAQGVGGSVSATTVGFAAQYLAEWEPDFVAIYHGANDIILMSRFPEFDPITDPANRDRAWAAVREHYERLAAMCREMDARLIVITFPGPVVANGSAELRARIETEMEAFPELGGAESYWELLQSYNQMLTEFAAANRAVLVDVAGPAAMHPEYFVDEAHVTPEGDRAYARIIADALEPLIRSCRHGGCQSP